MGRGGVENEVAMQVTPSAVPATGTPADASLALVPLLLPALPLHITLSLPLLLPTPQAEHSQPHLLVHDRLLFVGPDRRLLLLPVHQRTRRFLAV